MTWLACNIATCGHSRLAKHTPTQTKGLSKCLGDWQWPHRHILEPYLFAFIVGGQIALAAKIRRIDARWVQAVHLGQKLPGERNGLFLEVVTEGPVAEHLKERVVVRVLTDVVQVVVFTSGADTFLRVGSSLPLGHVTGRVNLAAHPAQSKGVTVRADRAETHVAPMSPPTGRYSCAPARGR
jgi:hypothetical protein